MKFIEENAFEFQILDGYLGGENMTDQKINEVKKRSSNVKNINESKKINMT